MLILPGEISPLLYCFTTGIRISELVGLNIADLNFNDLSFRVTRKGGSQSILYFDYETENALNEYLEQRKIQGTYSLAAPLFLSLQGNRITARAVENMVQKYAKLAAPLKHITPHKLRSTYGTMLYQQTGDIYLVADVLAIRMSILRANTMLRWRKRIVKKQPKRSNFGRNKIINYS